MNNLDSLVAYFETAFREEIKTIGQTVPLKLSRNKNDRTNSTPKTL